MALAAQILNLQPVPIPPPPTPAPSPQQRRPGGGGKHIDYLTEYLDEEDVEADLVSDEITGLLHKLDDLLDETTIVEAPRLKVVVDSLLLAGASAAAGVDSGSAAAEVETLALDTAVDVGDDPIKPE